MCLSCWCIHQTESQQPFAADMRERSMTELTRNENFSRHWLHQYQPSPMDLLLSGSDSLDQSSRNEGWSRHLATG